MDFIEQNKIKIDDVIRNIIFEPIEEVLKNNYDDFEIIEVLNEGQTVIFRLNDTDKQIKVNFNNIDIIEEIN